MVEECMNQFITHNFIVVHITI